VEYLKYAKCFFRTFSGNLLLGVWARGSVGVACREVSQSRLTKKLNFQFATDCTLAKGVTTSISALKKVWALQS